MAVVTRSVKSGFTLASRAHRGNEGSKAKLLLEVAQTQPRVMFKTLPSSNTSNVPLKVELYKGHWIEVSKLGGLGDAV